MCLSLELDFGKFTQKNYRMPVMKHPRPHAHMLCRYRRPHHGSSGAVVGVRCRTGKAKHVAETLPQEFLSNACSPSCLDNLLRLEAPAHTDALGHDAVVDNGSGTRSSRATTSDGSAALSTQLARGMVAAAQLCFTNTESRAWLRSLVVSLSEDIDANVIHKLARGNYDPLTHAGFVDNRGKRPHVDEHHRASLIQAVMRKRKKGSVAGLNCDDGRSGSCRHARVAVCVVALLQ